MDSNQLKQLVEQKENQKKMREQAILKGKGKESIKKWFSRNRGLPREILLQRYRSGFGSKSMKIKIGLCLTCFLTLKWSGLLHSNRLRHLRPTPVLLSLQSAKIDSSHSQAAVVQEPAHILYCLPGVPA